MNIYKDRLHYAHPPYRLTVSGECWNRNGLSHISAHPQYHCPTPTPPTVVQFMTQKHIFMDHIVWDVLQLHDQLLAFWLIQLCSASVASSWLCPVSLCLPQSFLFLNIVCHQLIQYESRSVRSVIFFSLNFFMMMFAAWHFLTTLMSYFFANWCLFINKDADFPALIMQWECTTEFDTEQWLNLYLWDFICHLVDKIVLYYSVIWCNKMYLHWYILYFIVLVIREVLLGIWKHIYVHNNVTTSNTMRLWI